ncbi:protein ALP1-like isoform X1 [Solanum pennellii]|nr:protein ALP1-like [Solanum pennellii]XP_027770619.1 protein ALP1-like isoform X1 [Solanum pennellii]
MDSQQLCDVESFMILEEIVMHSYIVLICFFMAIYSMLLRKQSTNTRGIRYCMSARIPKILSHLNVLIRDNDIVCIDKLRMDRNAFHILASLAKNIGGLTDSKNMSSTEKLAMFLNILAHHEKNRSIKVDYIRSGWSVSRAFNECLRAILKLTPVLLVKPNPVLEDDSDDRWKWFKGCLGALDGTYISIRVEAIYKPRYRTRKGDIATNVLGVCDRNLNFIYVLPGWEGSAADGRVLRDAVVRRNGLKVPHGNYYLCDGGYTNGNGFLSPYRGYRYWLKDWQGDNPSPRCREELFNMKHARARNVIERTFGLLKGRWGILRSPSWYSVKVHNRIISACCLIHNFIRREMEADPLDVEMDFHMENQHEHENINTIETSDEWTTWRDELAQSM